MQIKFHKIKHSWKNNENAMWENSSNFDEKIFEEIIQNCVIIPEIVQLTVIYGEIL